MNFDGTAGRAPPKVTLRGASRHETDRVELLEKARQARQARQAAKQQQSAALAIQRSWRAAVTRHALRQQLRMGWLATHGPSVAQLDALMHPAELADRVLPPILLAYRQCQGPVPGAAPLGPALLRDTVALRGCLALLLRSLGSPQQDQSYLALALDPARRAGLLSQLQRLAALCCSVLGPSGPDPLTQAAAARVVCLLSDSTRWASWAPAGGPAGLSAEQGQAARGFLTQRWLGLLGCSPMLSLAARRLADQAAAAGAPQGASTGVGTSMAPSPQLSSMLNGLVAAQVKLWQQLGSAGGPAADTPAHISLTQLVLRVLTAPHLISNLSPATLAMLRQPGTFVALLGCATVVATGEAGVGTSNGGSGPVRSTGLLHLSSSLQPVDCLWLLANLTGLLAGKKVAQSTASNSSGSQKAVEYLPPSPLLQSHGEGAGEGAGGMAAAFAGAADSLLRRAAGGASGDALAALWPFSEGSFAAQLLAALPPNRFAHLFHSLLTTLDAGGASTGPGAAPRSSSSGGGGQDGSGGGGSGGLWGSARVLSALAFATPLLPQLWRWLGVAVGVPLEAPLQATRGWDIPTLGQGIRSVSPEAAEALVLFCRVNNHYLMVTDDFDFHERQTLFSLGHQRAITATLNTLLFRTHLPAATPGPGAGAAGAGTSASTSAASAASAAAASQRLHGRGGSGGGPARQYSGKGPQYAMLLEHAPVLLRALYERDARRPFCPPSLWQEPYHNTSPPSPPPPPSPAPAMSPPASHAAGAGEPRGGAGGLGGLMRGLALRRRRSMDEEEPAQEDVLWGPAQPPAPSSAAAGAGTSSGGFSAAAVLRALLHAEGEGAAPQLPQQGGGGWAAASQPTALAAILSAAPQCVPFEERVAVFRALVDMDKERGGYNLAPVDGGPRPLPLTIRRSHILEDALAQLPRDSEALKGRLFVTFVNEQGLQEAGVDMGGLMKEFVEAVAQAGFDRNRGLISSTPDGFAHPNPLAERLEGGLAVLGLLGSVLGRALYEGILVDLPLAPFFVSRLQGRQPLFDELSALDPEVYRSLVALKQYEGDVADLALDFTVESDSLGAHISEELLPGGSSIPVTSANMLQYVYLVADWHLNKRLGVAAAAFGQGLSKVIPPSWLRLFSPKEINQLLGGGEGGEVDVPDMMRYAQYSGGYSESSSAVKSFWRVVEGMSQADRRALLKFVTSCSRAPLGGFRHLNPPLTIHKVDCDAAPLALLGGRDVERLPTASTCYNMLKLPNYRRTSTMREKLLYAIKSGAGFELS